MEGGSILSAAALTRSFDSVEGCDNDLFPKVDELRVHPRWPIHAGGREVR